MNASRTALHPRHQALHAHHDDIARLVTSAQSPVFWVLDLEDERGFVIAEASGSVAAQLRDRRDATRDCGEIAAMTLTTGLDCANTIIALGWQLPPLPPLPPGDRYLAVVSAGRLSIRKLTTS